MFRFFESRIDLFPPTAPAAPPKGLVRFIIHFSRPLLPWFGVDATLTALLSLVEISFVAFLGGLVDWLAAAERATFMADHGTALMWMGD